MRAKDGLKGDFRQWRRLRAVRLRRRGWRRDEVAEAFGVSETSVSHWLSSATVGGLAALAGRVAPGPEPELSEEQVGLIPEFLRHGSEAYGFRGALWTCGRVAEVIKEEFGVAYDKGHVSRLLKRLRWTPQMPILRAGRRDESAIEHWRTVAWPRLLREAKTERRTLVFVDEAGFYLSPSVVKTCAPAGQTPVLRAKLTRDHLSVMGGMTPAGRVYTLVRRESLDGSHSVEFLAHLLRAAGRRLPVIWDGSPIHRRTLVNEFVSEAQGRVRVEATPAYAPDLNPWDEGGWNHLKNVEMRNMTCRDLEELHEQFHLAVHRLRQKPRRIQAFYAQAGLDLETM